MDDIITSITAIVNSIFTADNADLLDFTINDVVDRFLVYTNRDQLVAQYEEDLEDETVDEEDYVLPIPERCQRPLARVIINTYRSIDKQMTATEGAVLEVSDHDQKVRYDKALQDYNTSDDSKVFGSSMAIFDKFIIASVIEYS